MKHYSTVSSSRLHRFLRLIAIVTVFLAIGAKFNYSEISKSSWMYMLFGVIAVVGVEILDMAIWWISERTVGENGVLEMW